MKRVLTVLSVFLICITLFSVKVIDAEEDKEEEVVTETADSIDANQVEDTAEPDETGLEGDAYAILTNDGDLIFFRSTTNYDDATACTVTINDISYTGTVYSGFEAGNNSWWQACESIKTVRVAEGDMIHPTSMASWFMGCCNMISFDAHGFDTSNVTDMSNLFSNCIKLTDLDLHPFDTSNVTDMSYMFDLCDDLETVDVSSFDTRNVLNMSYMFEGCYGLTTLDLSNFVTPKLTNASGLLHDCPYLISVDISNFDTSQVQNMDRMFNFGSTASAISIKLGANFTTWTSNAKLLSGNWKNGSLIKTETELQEQYPSHAEEWAGTWTREMPLPGDAYAILTDDGDLIFFRSYETYPTKTTATVTDIFDSSYTGIVYANVETISTGHDYGIPWYSKESLIKKVYVAPDQTIRPVCTSYWFEYCSNLTSFDCTGFDMSENERMDGLFYQCSSLSSVDISSFQTPSLIHIYRMFAGCSSLTSVDLSNIDASNIKNTTEMFKGCISLQYVDFSGFETFNMEYTCNMFEDCQSLLELDLSSFNTSKTYRMDYMFKNCYSLRYLDLSSFDTSYIGEKVSDAAMSNMFEGCSALDQVKLGSGFTKWMGENPYLRAGVWENKEKGIRKTEKKLCEEYPSHASEWAGMWTYAGSADLDTVLTFSSTGTFKVGLSKKTWNGTVEYSTDGKTWAAYTSAGSYINSGSDNRIYFRGSNNTTFSASTSSYASFLLSGNNISCSGNIESLLDYQKTQNGEDITLPNYCFYKLFNNCSSLVSAPELPALNLTNYCYSNMFYGCSSLLNAPELPATALAERCYYNMFYNCSSLIEAPVLPATTLANYCYAGMFINCSSLVHAPNLPASEATKGCYYMMFYGCTSLTEIPRLLATYLPSSCYGAMFQSCSSLKLSETRGNGYNIPYRIPTQGTGTKEDTYSINAMFDKTGGTFTGTPELNKTYYLFSGLYDIYFESNGGSYIRVSTGNKSIPDQLPEPVWDHYTFLGWYTDPELKNVVVSGTILTSDITLYAKWEREIYTVTFDSNGGTSIPSQQITYNNTATKPSDPRRTGYTFLYWTLNNEEYDFGTPVVESIELKAEWRENSYSIFYNGNGNTSGSQETDMRLYTESFTLPSSTGYEREEYVFTGWYDAATGGNKLTLIAECTASDVTVYAHWKANEYTITFLNEDGTVLQSSLFEYDSMPVYSGPTPTKESTIALHFTFDGWTPELSIVRGEATYTAKYRESARKYTVTFNSNGGSSVSSQQVAYNNKATKPTDPSKTGYAFLYWTLNGEEYDFNTPVTQNITLKAEWEERSYSIIYKGNGNTSGTQENDTRKYTESFTLPTTTNYEKTEYRFIGWYNSATGGSRVTTVSAYTAQNTTVYAHWKANEYTITFVNEDGTVLQSSKFEYDSMPSYNGPTPTKDSSISTDYTFNGWTPELSIVRGEATYTAIYRESARKYTVIFDSNGGSSVTAQQIEYGNTASIPSNPSKTGYSFLNWTLNGEEYDFNTPVVQDIVLQAEWTENSYSIFYNGNGNTSGYQETDKRLYTESFILPEGTSYEREEYVFTGWYDAASGGNKLTSISAYIANDVTVYAHWKANEYMITFINDDGTVLQSSEFEYDSMPVYSGPIPTKESTEALDFAFDGWTPELSIVKGETTYVARYEEFAREYTVTFDSNGGTSVASQQVAYDNKATRPFNPSKTGYSFLYWTLDGEEYDFNRPIMHDITLIAKWEPNVVITVNGQKVICLEKGKQYNFSFSITSPGESLISQSTVKSDNTSVATIRVFGSSVIVSTVSTGKARISISIYDETETVTVIVYNPAYTDNSLTNCSALASYLKSYGDNVGTDQYSITYDTVEYSSSGWAYSVVYKFQYDKTNGRIIFVSTTLGAPGSSYMWCETVLDLNTRRTTVIKTMCGSAKYQSPFDICYPNNSFSWSLVSGDGPYSASAEVSSFSKNYGVNKWDYYVSNMIGVRLSSLGSRGTTQVESVTTDLSTCTVTTGKSKKLNFSVYPSNASDKQLYYASYDENIVTIDSDGTVHGVKAGTANVICVSRDAGKSIQVSVTVIDPTNVSQYVRIFRVSRLAESIKVADELKKVLGVDKFKTIIVAKDSDFADALSGSYLAARNNAPILLVNSDNYQEACDYILANLSNKGKIYVLGSYASVAQSFEEGLSGYIIERLAGSSRYMTNLDILNEAGMSGKDIFVVTGTGFADSLSSASAGLPILMVDNSKTALKNSQIKWLKSQNIRNIYILGQEASVNASLEKALKAYGTVTRIGGSSRWETTRLVAEKFFSHPSHVVLATGSDFADGLIASPLAYALKSPLLMVTSNKTSEAKKYVTAKNVKKAYIIGSRSNISNEAARKILCIDDTVVILER